MSMDLSVDLGRAVWFKSSRSSGNCDNCVEVAFVDRAVAVRDSKDRGGAALVYGAPEWAACLAGVRAGEVDLDRSTVHAAAESRASGVARLGRASW
jgi:hypothetical protein